MPTTRPSSSTRRKLQIKFEAIAPDIYEVQVRGVLGMGSMNVLGRVFETIFEKGVSKIIVNLEDTIYMASAGIGAIIACAKNAREHGGDVVIAGASHKMLGVFNLLGIQSLFKFAGDLEEALRMIRSRRQG